SVFDLGQQTVVPASSFDKEKYNYFIITSSNLADGAKEYARYRSSSLGGNHKVLVMNIKDIYDLYNYEEPSPIGVRNFMKYMLGSDDTKAKNLLLIGRSTTYPLNLQKELVGEVPTIGDPGSDNLLAS